MVVHPHACGEHGRVMSKPVPLNGSSPRMWGTLHAGHGPRVVGRFIPTHVGNTQGRCTQTSMRSVHPHACGEHGGATGAGTGKHGSSPRMWGTRVALDAQCVGRRFIPTHVGNTFRIDAGRGCACGSSPRMWGTLEINLAVQRRHRFIPTHVGNTCPWPRGRAACPVHPHACGEHLRAVLVHGVDVRFIPTHVGNTRQAAARAARLWPRPPVHPHACGEHH